VTRSTPGSADAMTKADPRTRVLASGLAFPEGPAFAPDGTLWCVELKGGALVRISDGEAPLSFPVGGAPNGLVIDRRGRFWFCDADACAIRRFDSATNACEVVARSTPDQRLHRPNDLAFDRLGRLIFTCPGDSRHQPTGQVWRLDVDGSLHCVADGLYFPNGLAFADDGKTLVVAATYRHRLCRGAWDLLTGTWRNPSPFADMGGPVGPDGMALSSDGSMMVAVYGQSAIKRVTAEGKVETCFHTTGENPTNCAFDPSGRLGLIVTEAQRGEILAFPNVALGFPLFTP
jgi:gluconolactonase